MLIAVALVELIKYIFIGGMGRLFSWALSEPDLSELELEDDKGWHLIFRQTAPFLWPEGRRNLFENDHLADNFAKLHKLESFRHENG
eukprot:5702882-Prymnesium_polylepis.1